MNECSSQINEFEHARGHHSEPLLELLVQLHLAMGGHWRAANPLALIHLGQGFVVEVQDVHLPVGLLGVAPPVAALLLHSQLHDLNIEMDVTTLQR